MTDRRVALAMLGVVLAAAALYAPTLGFGFVWDDRDLVRGNPWLASVDGLRQAFGQEFWAFKTRAGGMTAYYRPLVHLSLFVLRWAFGLAPAAFHAVLVVLHAISTALVATLGWRLAEAVAASPRTEEAPDGETAGGGASLAWLAGPLAAWLFATHPVHVEAVAWVSGLCDVGATVGVLLGLVVVASARGAQVGWLLALALVCALAPGFKETGFLAAPLAVAWVWSVRRSQGATLAERWAWTAAALGGAGLALALRSAALAGVVPTPRHAELGGVELVLTGVALGFEQLRLLLWPASLSVWHTLVPAASLGDGRVIGGLAVLSLAGRALLRWWRPHPAQAFLALGLMLSLAPGTFVPRLGENALAERYLYLPSIFPCLAAAALVILAARRGLGRAAVAGVVLLGCGLGAISLGTFPVWASDATFFAELEGVAPHVEQLGLNLGAVALEEGDPRRALEHFRRRPSDTPDYWSTRAVAHAQLGQMEEAERCLRRSLELQPRNPEALANLCQLERRAGRLEEALHHCGEAVAQGPGLALVRVIAGNALEKAGRVEEARREYAAALAIEPGNARAREGLEALRRP